MTKINRRQFLALSAAGAGAAIFASCRRGGDNYNQVSFNASASLPQVHQSSNGLLELDLEASETLVNLGEQQAYLLTYNRQIPAPRLETKAGDKVRIHFTNRLTQPTNLHYHGLHIPVTGSADNVFLHIASGEKFTYEFEIPSDHPSGTFWYHPHLHGLVAEQLFGGLAGLFIVRGETDEIPEIASAKEEFLVLQDFAWDEGGRLINSAHMSLMMGREGNIVTVNGKVNPSFSLPDNGLLRLRILNASPSRFYRLALEDHSMYQIATDGSTLTQPVEIQELLLTPGQRAEVLIQGNQEANSNKSYRLLNLPYDRGSMGMGGGMMGNRGMMGRNQSDAPMALATFNYEANTVASLTLPDKLASISPLPQPQQVKRFELNHGMSRGVGMAFLINGQPYSHDRLDTRVKLNSVEDWEIVNTGVMDHPFHVHGNAFQVVSRDGVAEPILAWRDTVLVKRGETVRIRIPFRDFAGKTVYHCHILDHEDLGMMGNLMIEA